jgi:diphosphomevalonate decarboxylase
MKTIATSPVNIALIKYWGKADETKVLPTTTSLSLTLSDLVSTTTIEPGPFKFTLDGRQASEEEQKRVMDVLKHFKDDQVQIDSFNNFPTAAGLASSASGFAALTVGLNHYFQAGLTQQELAYLTRIGSGSSCRSLVDGFAIWDRQGHVDSVVNPFDDLMMIIVLVSQEKKAISSREAMKITKTSSPLYQQWIEDSLADFEAMMEAIQQKNLHHIGMIMEQNSLRLHEVMRSSNPAIIYKTDQSENVLQAVLQARLIGLEGYATMDAGANVKILMRSQQQHKWQDYLKQTIKLPTLLSKIGGCAYAKAR